MTRQEYRDLLITKSNAGEFPAGKYDEELDQFLCSYRAENGRRCVVGLIIPDDRYDPEIEGSNMKTLKVVKCIDFPDGVTQIDLEELQHLHDNLSNENPWPTEKFNTRVCEILG